VTISSTMAIVVIVNAYIRAKPLHKRLCLPYQQTVTL
jgi:hypothetical protein